MGLTPDIRVRTTRAPEGSVSILGRAFPFSRNEALRLIAPLRDFWEKSTEVQPALTLKTLLELEREALLGIGYDISSLDESGLLKCRRKVLEFLSQESKRDYADFLLVLVSVYAGGRQWDTAKKILEAVVVGDSGNAVAKEDVGRVYAAQGKIPQAIRRFEEAEANMVGYKREKNEEQIIEIYTEVLKIAEKGEIDYSTVAKFFQSSFGKENDLFGLMMELVESVGRNDGSGQCYVKELLKSIEYKRLLPEPEINQIKSKMIEVENEERLKRSVNLAMEDFGRVKEMVNRQDEEQLIRSYQEAIYNLEKKSGEGDWEQVVEGLRETAVDMLGIFFANEKKLADAVALAAALLKVDSQLRRNIAELLEALIKDNKTRLVLAQKLGTLRNKAWEVASRMPEEKSGSLTLIESTAVKDFQRLAEIHDFFFVFLCETAGMNELYRDAIGVPYDEPSSLNSNRFEAMANGTPDVKHKIKLLRKAVQEDRNNVSARLKLMINLGLIQEINQSDLEANILLQENHNPLINYRVYCVQVRNICLLIRKLTKQGGNNKKIREKLEQAEMIFAKAQAIVNKIDLDDSEMEFARKDWLMILRDMGVLHSLAHNPIKALKYINKATELDQRDEETVIVKGSLLFELGKFSEARRMFERLIEESGGAVTNSHYHLAWALFHLNEPREALDQINKVLLKKSRPPLYLLVAARCYVSLGDVGLARLLLDEVEERLREKSQEINTTTLKELNGTIGLIKMGLLDVELLELMRNKPRTEAIEAELIKKEKQIFDLFQHSLKYVKGDYNLEFNEMEIRYCITNIVAGWGDNDPKRAEEHFKRAVALGKELQQKFPFFLPGHDVLVAPLMRLGRKAEALAQIEWIEKRRYGLTVEVVESLLILMSSQTEENLRDQAKKVFYSLYTTYKEDYPENGSKKFRDGLVAALEELKDDGNDLSEDLELMGMLVKENLIELRDTLNFPTLQGDISPLMKLWSDEEILKQINQTMCCDRITQEVVENLLLLSSFLKRKELRNKVMWEISDRMADLKAEDPVAGEKAIINLIRSSLDSLKKKGIDLRVNSKIRKMLRIMVENGTVNSIKTQVLR